MKDEEFLKFKKIIDSFEHILNQVFATEFMPFLKLFLHKSFYTTQDEMIELFDIAKQKYKSHQNDYHEGLLKDFTDGLLAAKIDSIKNSKENAPYLTDNNLAVTVIQLIIGFYQLIIGFNWILISS